MRSEGIFSILLVQSSSLLPLWAPSQVSLLSLRDLNRKCPLKFVHSSFHGVGHSYVQQAFLTFGFNPPIPVPEQRDPDPNFPSVRCPNPEEGESVLVGAR